MNQSGTGYAGTDNAPTPREPTLNERLNKLSEKMQSQCDRIENVLCRVNGTPTAAPSPIRTGEKLAQLSPTLPLGTVVEHLESVQARLQELASGIERIA